MRNPIFCALDMPDVSQASAMAVALAPHLGGIKLGLEFFMNAGPNGVKRVRPEGMPLFLDVKLHDIPNTVAGAVRSLSGLAPDYVTVHASGGEEMLRAAVDAAAAKGSDMALLGVTVLTSLGQGDLADMGVSGTALDQVKRLAALSQKAGLKGVVCSPMEVAAVRAECGPDFVLAVPGIRPPGDGADDQKRVMAPVDALDAGADLLVVGRPITRAQDPAKAAQLIAESLPQ